MMGELVKWLRKKNPLHLLLRADLSGLNLFLFI